MWMTIIVVIVIESVMSRTVEWFVGIRTMVCVNGSLVQRNVVNVWRLEQGKDVSEMGRTDGVIVDV